MASFTARKPRSPTAGRFDSPQQEAFLNLWRTYDRLRLLEEEVFGRYGLSAQQYNALRLLRGAFPGKLTTLGIASRLISRGPDITRLLDKLEQRKLIERTRSAENRRCVLVGITAAGLELLAALDKPVRDCHLRQLGHLRQEELEALISLLCKARQPHEPADSFWR
jgi:DNA-binding MarR family transcriptional regulator